MTTVKIAALEKRFSELYYELHELLKQDMTDIVTQELGKEEIEYIQFERSYEASTQYHVSLHTTLKHEPYDPAVVNAERLIQKYITDNWGAALVFYFGDADSTELHFKQQ